MVRQKDGCTLREHLAAAERSVGPIERLHRRPPAPVEYVWRWFTDLHAARADRIPISFVDIQSWAVLTRAEPTPFEVALIRRLDMVATSDPKAWDENDG